MCVLPHYLFCRNSLLPVGSSTQLLNPQAPFSRSCIQPFVKSRKRFLEVKQNLTQHKGRAVTSGYSQRGQGQADGAKPSESLALTANATCRSGAAAATGEW